MAKSTSLTVDAMMKKSLQGVGKGQQPPQDDDRTTVNSPVNSSVKDVASGRPAGGSSLDTTRVVPANGPTSLLEHAGSTGHAGHAGHAVHSSIDSTGVAPATGPTYLPVASATGGTLGVGPTTDSTRAASANSLLFTAAPADGGTLISTVIEDDGALLDGMTASDHTLAPASNDMLACLGWQLLVPLRLLSAMSNESQQSRASGHKGVIPKIKRGGGDRRLPNTPLTAAYALGGSLQEYQRTHDLLDPDTHVVLMRMDRRCPNTHSSPREMETLTQRMGVMSLAGGLDESILGAV